MPAKAGISGQLSGDPGLRRGDGSWGWCSYSTPVMPAKAGISTQTQETTGLGRKLQASSASRIFAIFSRQTRGAMWWTLAPAASTATVTGMSSTSNS